MDSRVGSLELTIRAERPNGEGIRPAAEAFAIRVLQRCDEMLEQRSPGRVFVLRHLDLWLRLVDGGLADPDEIDGFAADIAEHLERTASSIADEHSDDDVAAFADEVAWRAAHVEAHANGSAGEMWKFASLDDEGEPLRALARRDRPELLRDVLLRLHRRGTLLKILEPLPEDVLGAIARVLEQPAIAAARERRTVEDELPDAVVRCVRDLASTASLTLGWIAIATAARDSLGPSRADADVCEVARLGFARLLENRSIQATGPRSKGDALPDPQIESDRRPGERATREARLTRNESEAPSTITSVVSEFGGMFYLLRPAIEVSLGECLWRACLPDGLVLSRAVGVLLGDEAMGDPAPLLFGGVRSNDALPPVSPEQQHEVSHTVFAAMVEVLLRRELMASCEPVLHLVNTPQGRLFVASAEAGPYVLFALPANSREEMVAALESFLTIWPPSAPRPRAGYALAAFDRRGRVREWRGRSRDDAPLVSNAGSLLASALLTQAAGTLGHLFAARAGADPHATHHDLVERYFRVPALVMRTPQTLDVYMPMEAVNLDVRRAGLDIDPGWIPWLNRRAAFRFEETDGCGQSD